MSESRAQQFAAVFAPDALTAGLPLRLTRDGLSEGLACSLRCGAEIFDRSIGLRGPGVAIELANPFETHDLYCGWCAKRIS